MRLRVRAGELEPGPQWVYAWLAHDGVVYVGATRLHPETRMWLHLHHDDPEIGRMRARFEGLAAEDLDVVAVELADDVDRQQVRHGAVALLAERGMLSGREVCDPPLPAEPTSQAEELVAAVVERQRLMRRAVCLGAVLVLVAGCGGTKTVTRTVTVDSSAKRGVGAPLERVEFGYIKSLEPKGTGYELKFDPAWFLAGETANKAAAEDGAVPPGEPVPNDHYVVDEGHRVLTYRVPPNAKVTVLVDGPESKPITVEELARIVGGDHKPLWEPIETGFWIRYRVDTVSSLDQQYRP